MTTVKSGTVSDYQKQRRAKAKERALDYLGAQCAACKSTTADDLRFVHKDPDSASFSISAGLTKGWETLRDELDKCRLLCRDCKSKGFKDAGMVAVERQERQRKLQSKYILAGQEYHAQVAFDQHNDHLDSDKPLMECECDFCEDERAGRELPEIYRKFLPLRKF